MAGIRPIAPHRPAPSRPAGPPSGGGGPEMPSPLEAVIATGTEAQAAKIGRRELKPSIIRADKLRKEAQGLSGTEFIAAAGKEPVQTLDATELTYARAQLGDTPQMAQIESFNTYTSIQQDMERGMKLDDVLKARKMTRSEYNIVRNLTLNGMVDSQLVKDLFPEITTLPLTEQAQFVETYLANNPTARGEIYGRIRDVIQKAEAIPPAQAIAEVKPTPDQAPQLAAEQQKIIARMQAQLTAAGFKLDAAQLDQIKAQYDGRGMDRVIDSAFDTILAANGVANPRELAEHVTLLEQPGQIAAKIAGIQAQMDMLDTSSGIPRLAQLGGERSALEHQKQLITDQIEGYTKTHPSATAEVAKYRRLSEEVYGRVRPDGKKIPGMDEDLAKLGANIEAQTKVVPATEAPAAALTPEQQRLQAERDRMQRELNGELSSATTEGLRTAIEEMYEDARTMQDRVLAADAAEAAEHANDPLKKALDAIQAGRKHYSEWDPKRRKRKTNRKHIGNDMRYLAANGADGVKRLVLRDMLQGGAIELVDKNGVAIPDANVATVDMSMLKDADLLDQVYASHGSVVRNRVVTEFMGARARRDVVILGKNLGDLAMTDGEYAEFDRNFRGELKAAMDADVKFKNEIDALKASGVNPNSSTGILMSMAMLAGFAFNSKDRESATI